ncbi:hypothetical protein [Alloalcanivorax mobilis]|uniref:hypothetical protein n=1 Tax=Alloalcanivorax mobilis TaxID=2019569 RepID=UPI0012FFFBD4|nr:hypothetical protein [Alloalcanivorax mobilis]
MSPRVAGCWLGPPLALLLVAAVAWRAWLPDTVAARIDGVPLSREVLRVFLVNAEAAADHGEPVTERQVLAGLIDVHLLGRWYRSERWAHRPPERVGYDRASRERRQLYLLVRGAYAAELARALHEDGRQSPLAYLLEPPALDVDALAPLLKVEPGLYATLPETRADAARGYVLAHYRFAGGERRSVTLWQLYQRQNLQMKVQFQALNVAAMGEALRQFMAEAYVLDWFERRAGLPELDRRWVRQLVADAEDQRALVYALGLSDDPHDDNPLLRQQAAAIRPAAIRDFYRRHRRDFERVEAVRAGVLRLPSQQLADRAYQSLRRGTPATALARMEGVAYQPPHWIDRGSGHPRWLTGFAFVQQPGQPSAPVRAPLADPPAHWVILLVEERRLGYQDPASESVRYQASMALAHQALQRRFEQGLTHWRSRSVLQINTEIQ